MFDINEKLKKILSELKFDFGMIGIKSELEAEGADFEDILYLKKVSDSVGTDFIVKIGGCEAINDLIQLKRIGVKNIVAPMIESDFAARKYISAIKKIYSSCEIKDMKFYINIETVTGYEKLYKICEVIKNSFISGIVLGRTDMAASKNLPKEDVNSEEMYEIASDMISVANSYGLEFIIGGGISIETDHFLGRLKNLKMIETRKVLFEYDNIPKNMYTQAIKKAIEFEMLWLNYLIQTGKNPELKYSNRIEQLKKRICV